MAPSPSKPATALPALLSPRAHLVHKQRRFLLNQDAASSAHLTSPPTLDSPFFSDLDSKAIALDGLLSMEGQGTQMMVLNEPLLPSKPPNVSDRIHPAAAASAMLCLEQESYAAQSEFARESQKDKQTGATYKRYFNKYLEFWGRNQLERKQVDPLWMMVEALPLTATKVSLFIKHEMQREKKKRGSQDSIPNSTVGKSVISGTITALEYHRFQNQHLYKHEPETQTPLRQDSRIRQLEDAAKHKEPQRVENSLERKAAGSSCDTYKMEELCAMTRWCLTKPSGAVQLTIHIRDRAMLLVSTVLAFRGDSARQVLWSDLFRGEVINHGKGIDSTIPTLGVLADNAKHNQNGRIDEHGATRHRNVELCAVGGLALFFFAHWHIGNNPIPVFSPDMSRGGEYGVREWYGNHIFHASDITKPMSYDNHWERIKQMHEANGVSTYKATHAGRVYFAKNTRRNGASADDTKAMGGWNDNGSFRPCYDTELPLSGLLAAAGFSGVKSEAHFLAREHLCPPESLTAEIFPWIELELDALIKRQHANKNAKDIALKEFLATLRWFRTVLVQDLAVLSHLVPTSRVFQYAPFNTESFRTFAGEAVSAITACELEARAAFQNLPANLVEGLRNVLTKQDLAKSESDRAIASQIDALRTQMNEVIGMVGVAVAGNGLGRRRGKKPIVSSATVGASIEDLPPPMPSDTPVSHSPPAMPAITINISNTCPGTSTAPMSTKATAQLGDLSDLCASQTVSSATVNTTDHDGLTRAPLLNLPAALTQNVPMTAQQQSLAEKDIRVLKWDALVSKFGATKVRKHSWDWFETGWLPRYDFQRAATISDVWREHSEGLNGFLSVRELQEEWGASWMRNEGRRKTECSRRKKIVTIVNDLAAKRRWTTQLALHFLSDRYETKFKTARLFSDWLTRDKGMNRVAVLKEAESYRHKSLSSTSQLLEL